MPLICRCPVHHVHGVGMAGDGDCVLSTESMHGRRHNVWQQYMDVMLQSPDGARSKKDLATMNGWDGDGAEWLNG